jgi:hypothetical protein
MNGMHYEEQFRPGGKDDGGQLAMQYGERSGEEAAKYLWKRSSGGRWSEIKPAAVVPGFSCPRSVWGRRMGVEGSLDSQTGMQIPRPAVWPRFPGMPGDLDSASWRTSVRRAGRRRQENCGGESFSDGKGKGRTHAPSPIPLEGGEVCAPRSHSTGRWKWRSQVDRRSKVAATVLFRGIGPLGKNPIRLMGKKANRYNLSAGNRC